MSKRAKKIIDEIQNKCADGIFVFRGTPQVFSKEKDGVSSSLYHAIKERGNIGIQSVLSDMEEDIIGKSKKYFPDSSSNIEIITELRHYEYKVNVIDFSRDLFVALFFACNSCFDEDGEIIFVNLKYLQEIKEIDYKGEYGKSAYIRPAETATSKVRVIAQKSMFIYDEQGYLDKKYYKKCKIPARDKEEILIYLKNFHDIDQDSIYNDFIGFVMNNENDALIFFRCGLEKFESGDNEGAKKDLETARGLTSNIKLKLIINIFWEENY